jgi:hypothetical protein
MPTITQDWGPAFYAELRSITRTQWPTIPDAQYFLIMESSFEDVVQDIRQVQQDQGIPPPYIVVDVGEFNPVDDWGLQNRFKWAKLRITYIIEMIDNDPQHLTMQAQAQTDIYLLSEVLDASDTTGSGVVSPQTFRPIANAQIDSSMSQPYNSAFRATNVTLWGCSLYYEEGVLVGNLDTFDQNQAKTATGNMVPA